MITENNAKNIKPEEALEETQIESNELGLDTKPAEETVTAEDAADIVRGTSRLKLYTRRFFRNKLAVIGLIIFLFLVVLAIVGEYFTSWSFDDPDFLNISSPPSPEHWFGTNDSGNDLFAQTAHGLG